MRFRNGDLDNLDKAKRIQYVAPFEILHSTVESHVMCMFIPLFPMFIIALTVQCFKHI